jgi:hypothetical protein
MSHWSVKDEMNELKFLERANFRWQKRARQTHMSPVHASCHDVCTHHAVDGIAFVDNLAEKRHGQTTL